MSATSAMTDAEKLNLIRHFVDGWRRNSMLATTAMFNIAGVVNPEPPRRRSQAEPGECAYCDREREAGNSFFPPHDASQHCESGKHAHCSCDTCF